ncbi:MAG TPA: hemerythrin family protein [Candidatus Cybelea sp.]|nr:hemerythrin family protein [Candidatus Cybelea sp.]
MTDTLRWSKSFSIGHKGLDAEHRGMIDLINRFCLARGADLHMQHLLSGMRELESLTEKHFKHEEAMLEEHYLAARKGSRVRESILAAKTEHAVEHQKSLSLLREMSRTLPADAGAARSKLCGELKKWFIDHAVGYDAQMKTIVQSA